MYWYGLVIICILVTIGVFIGAYVAKMVIDAKEDKKKKQAAQRYFIGKRGGGSMYVQGPD